MQKHPADQQGAFSLQGSAAGGHGLRLRGISGVVPAARRAAAQPSGVFNPCPRGVLFTFRASRGTAPALPGAGCRRRLAFASGLRAK